LYLLCMGLNSEQLYRLSYTLAEIAKDEYG